MASEEENPVRDNIMQQATNLFMQQGYNGVSMREIAEACDLSKAGLYYHFKNKEDLFLEILYQNLKVLSALVQAALQLSAPTKEKIKYFAHGIFSVLKEDQSILIRLASQDLKNLSTEKYALFSTAYQEGFMRPVASMLSDGMQRGELRKMNSHTATWALLGVLYPFLDFKMDATLREQQIDDVMQIFFDGISQPVL
ncbi:MAG: TetR/AcrR family transcriptional regulator [Anaerolineaceae bacterium]|nr:TetR/AcrR family transcriptional regulator [Anaerolineaceae bacterium]